MEELVLIHKDLAQTTSRIVAETFGKRHGHVLEKIEKIIKEDSTEKSVQCFSVGYYEDTSGKRNKMYYMNRDGYTFLVMGFTGKKANEWKWKYIEAFNKMESFIRTAVASRVTQKDAMAVLKGVNGVNAQMYQKANTIANKAVSNKYGYPKMIKKADMSEEMLKDREKILKDTVDLMALNAKFDLGISVSQKIYGSVGNDKNNQNPAPAAGENIATTYGLHTDV